MTKPTPHPHAEMITEWLQDTSREMQGRNLNTHKLSAERNWRPQKILDVMASDTNWEFRFSHTIPVEQKHEIVSSLTDEELFVAALPWLRTDDCRRAIANAAAQKAIEDFLKFLLHKHSEHSFLANDAYALFANLKEGKL